MTESLLNLSKRTVSKITQRLKLGCVNCGWNITNCDIHHIIPISKGGSDCHDNLTYLCPNCHRMAHNGLEVVMTPLTILIGDSWKAFYFPERAGIKKDFLRKLTKKQIEQEKKKFEKASRIEDIKSRLLCSGIDFSKFGWVEKASYIIEVSPQKVANWMRNNFLDFYSEKCFMRRSR